jgi:TusA-related sulfurtransferase
MASKGGKIQVRKINEKRYELDVRGLTCPYPQLLTMRTLIGLSSDDVLEVILDNPPSAKDVPSALEERGYKVEVSRLNSSTWKIIIQAKK